LNNLAKLWSATRDNNVKNVSDFRRALAVLEVVAVFVVTHLLIKSFKQLTSLGTQERSAGLNFSPGIVMVAMVAVLLLVKQNAKSWGLWPLRVPRLFTGSSRKVFSAIALLYLPPLLMYVFFKRGPVLLMFLGSLTTTAVAEEIFFRGYMQSRLNEVFGRPYSVRGIRFGEGLIIATLIFGFLHGLNAVDYFHGHYTFDWLWAATSVVPGLIYGLMREAKGNILPGSMAHGLWDVWFYGLLAVIKGG
jgi:membrane protease YdiL (CAAX protease family)